MKTSQILAFIAVGISLIASANVPRLTPDPVAAVAAPAAPSAPVQLAPIVVTESDGDAATRALLAEQRKALVAEARRQVAPPRAPVPSPAP